MIKLGENKSTPTIPEGRYVFKIEKVEYDSKFGKMIVTSITKAGLKKIETYNLVKADGTTNEAAINAFSYFTRIAMGDFNLQQVEEQELVGHYFKADITHTVVPSNKEEGQTVTFSHYDKLEMADGFETAETVVPSNSDTPAKVVIDL